MTRQQDVDAVVAAARVARAWPAPAGHRWDWRRADGAVIAAGSDLANTVTIVNLTLEGGR